MPSSHKQALSSPLVLPVLTSPSPAAGPRVHGRRGGAAAVGSPCEDSDDDVGV